VEIKIALVSKHVGSTIFSDFTGCRVGPQACHAHMGRKVRVPDDAIDARSEFLNQFEVRQMRGNTGVQLHDCDHDDIGVLAGQRPAFDCYTGKKRLQDIAKSRLLHP